MSSTFRDIALVAAPIVLMGVAGTLIGISTLTGGAVINLGYVLAILAGGFVLRRKGQSWREIGLKRPAGWIRTISLGAAAFLGALFLFVVTQIVVAAVLTALNLVPPAIDQSRFNPLVGNLPLFVLMVILAWTTIAFGEELFYRAFLISQLRDGLFLARWPAITISGIIFGIVHFAEGPVGILSNMAFGLLFAWIYIRSGRNLWITIIGHGLLNTFRFALLFAGAA